MSKESEERTFQGLGVSPGIGIGVAYVRDSGIVAVPEYSIPDDGIKAERARFRDATARARRQIGRVRAKGKSMSDAAAEELGYLLDAYHNMLKDSRLVRGVDRRISEDRVNAEAAIRAELNDISESFAAMDDSYIAARLDDIRGVADRLIRNLTKEYVKPFSQLRLGTVIVADEVTPADTALMDPRRIFGIATIQGGTESHTAIMARALGLPAVLGVPGLVQAVRNGKDIIVDGDTGRVVVDPTPSTIAAFERRREEKIKEKRVLARLRRLPTVTRDGIEVVLRANVEIPFEMNLVGPNGAQGIGLLRTEFMFMNRDDIPSEGEQYEVLRGMVDGAGGRSVTIRTLDVGGEKTAAALMDDYAGSASSALGLRGIRLSLTRVDVLESQFRAILRAAAYGRVRILLPMVTTVSEVRRAREILERAARRLKRRGETVADPLPPVGIMIEVPGAALAADTLARNCDFFAIGSNDLTMYTLAADRGDEQVAHIYNPLHPAVLHLIQGSVESALKARIPVTICGEMAGDPRFSALLLGMGFRELSMTASSIPRVKQRIRALDLAAAEARARVIMDQVDAGRIAMLLDDFNALA